ncbi:MAG: hypothetical protein IGBAC_0116 [Ignavibacteriae bacterium]|nr:MAG: hypothetical protein IGBAC_0116 [Ignavibacteriota bacterium]
MFLIVGLIAITAVILTVLYFYVFRRVHKVISYIVIFILTILLLVSSFMHLIIVGILVFGIGLFLISLAEKLKGNRQVATNEKNTK